MKRQVFISATRSSILEIPWDLSKDQSITLKSEILKSISSGSLSGWPIEFKQFLDSFEFVTLSGPSKGWWKY